MTEQEAIKINGWTFEETVKTAENLMESERNMFKWDVLRHLRDFAELFCEELREYHEIGTPEECRAAVEKQKAKKPDFEGDGYADGNLVYDTWICPCCGKHYEVDYDDYDFCPNCGQKLDWSDESETHT